MTRIGISEDDQPGPSLAGNPAAGNPEGVKSADLPAADDEGEFTPLEDRPLASETPAPPKVRHAGTGGMASDPEDWDKHDEAVDESFPASDPPSVSPGAD